MIRVFIFVFFTVFNIAFGGSFVLNPLKIEITPNQKIKEIDVTNTSTETIHLQVESFLWEQNEQGRPVWTKNKELIYFPKIFKMKPKEKRVVRVSYKGDFPKIEKAYRIFIRELPVTEPGKKGVKVSLRLSIPLFIKPKKQFVKLDFEKINVENSNLKVVVRNRGTVHTVVKSVNLIGKSPDGKTVFSKEKNGWYILPNSPAIYTFKLNKEECSKLGRIFIKIKTEKEEISREAELKEKKCS